MFFRSGVSQLFFFFFLVKGPIVNILGSGDHMVSFATAQVHPCSTKATTDNTYELGYVSIKLYTYILMGIFIQYIHQKMWLFFNKTTITKTGDGPDVVHRLAIVCHPQSMSLFSLSSTQHFPRS